MNVSEKRTGETLTVVSVKAKAKEVRVLLSNGDKISLSVNSFTEFHLYAGKELSPKELDALLAFSAQDEAYTRAINYVSRDAYSTVEMERKLLAKGYEPKVVSSVIGRLTEAGLLDDMTFARTYAEDVSDLRLVGYNRVLFELRSKGVSEEIIAQLSFPREVELDKAIRYAKGLDRRYYRVPFAKRVLRINRALLERGFDESVAYEAAKATASPIDPDVEKAELEKAYALAEAKYSRKYEGYELSRHIYASLARKGFPHDHIKAIMEEHGK